MNTFKFVLNELAFSAKDRTLLLWMAVVLCLSSLSVGFGLSEVQSQKKVIENAISYTHTYCT